jgi:iron complex transport system substrate-binding protein
VASALVVPERGKRLLERFDADARAAREVVEKVPSHPKVLVVLARGSGVLMVSGTGTAADRMIALVGAVNAVKEYEGYKPLTAESAVAAAPDVILTSEAGLASMGGIDGLLRQPGLALTPAGKSRRIVTADDLSLLGFGPRTGTVLLDLASDIHPDVAGPTRGQR